MYSIQDSLCLSIIVRTTQAQHSNAHWVHKELLVCNACVWVLFQLTDRDSAVLTHLAVWEHTVPDLTAPAAPTALLQPKFDPKVMATKPILTLAQADMHTHSQTMKTDRDNASRF